MGALNRKIMEGLLLSKFLYQKAVKESFQKGIASKLSILTFHNSVEMFLYMASLFNKKPRTQKNFMRFWKDFPKLTHKNEMDSFNTVRNKLKHEGIEPSSKSVIDSRMDILDFFNSNTKYLFNINYSEITLTSLIEDLEIKKLMNESENALNEENYQYSMEKSAEAFYRTLYVQNTWIKTELSERRTRQFTRRVRGNLIVSDFQEEEEQRKEDELKMIQSLLIDTRKYFQFKKSIIEIIRYGDGRITVVLREEDIRKEIAQFCFDFAIDVILSIQEYD